MNLYTYCRNNPIRYVDPSGHSYGLINGEKFSINSAWDAKKFNELKSGKSSSSQVATTTVPKAFDSPITGGISKQLTSTTTYTTVITDTQISTSKKNTNMFSRSINWIDENIATPFVNGAVKFGKAVYHSTSFELGMGFGLGAEGKLGCINGSALVVPIRNEYIIADDCKTNSTSKFSIGADFGEIFGLGAEAKCFAYNGDKIGQGRENAKNYLRENPAICAEAECKVRERYGLQGDVVVSAEAAATPADSTSAKEESDNE